MNALRVLFLVAAVLCGCGSIQQTGSKTVTLTGQSIGGGSDTRSVACSGAGLLTVTWKGSAGTMEVTVTSGSTSVYSNTFPAQAAEQTVTQALPASTLDLLVTRSTDWNGGYTVKAECP